MGRVQLGQAFLMLGDPAQARTLLEEAQTLYRTAPRAPLLARSLEALAGAVSGVNTTASTAGTVTTAELRVLQYLPTHFSYPEIAQIVECPTDTVKTRMFHARKAFNNTVKFLEIDGSHDLWLAALVD